ncbi:MAG: hypothetical protein GY870_03935 [archaeon]|nr:hypothetical protein [archaeon]
MKKLLILLLGMFLCASMYAQFGTGVVKTLTVDTLKGNNNNILATFTLRGDYDQCFITVKVDRISTAAGGTLYLKTGMDAASAIVVSQTTNPSVEFAANDTMATSDVATQYWNINITEPGFKYYEIFGDGDVNDTVKVTTEYILK